MWSTEYHVSFSWNVCVQIRNIRTVCPEGNNITFCRFVDNAPVGASAIEVDEVFGEMNHIKELPTSTTHEAIRVPYIQGRTYDNQGFTDFSKRKECDLEAMYKGSLMYEEKQQTAKELLPYVRTTSIVTEFKAMIEFMGSELHLAVCVLGSTLDKARLTLKFLVSHGIPQQIELEKPLADFDKMEDDGVSFGASSILRRRMLENGWFPFHVQRLENDVASAAMYFSSMLQRLVSGINHAHCTTDTCVVNKIDNATCKSKHSLISCDCDLIKPPKDIAKILKARGIPVIAVKSRGLTDLELRVVPHWIANEESDTQKNLPYIAIPHVWADGLGSTKDNSLPQCRIRRLMELIGSIYTRLQNCRNEKLEDKAQI